MTTIPEAYEEFLAAQSVAGLKPRSLSWYKTMLKPLIIQLYQKDIREVSAVDIRLALSYLKSRSTRYKDAPQRCETTGGLSQQTVRDHFAAFRRFFSWIWLEYELDPRLNPMRKVPMPKRTEYEPKAITLDDLMALLKACDDSLQGRRNRAMIAFLADTGCRSGGLVSLTLDRLNLEEMTAIVHEKGGQARTVPFGEYTRDMLLSWLKVRPYTPDHDRVFVGLATNDTGSILTGSGLSQVLERLKRIARVTGRVNPHSFRHGFARQYLLNGGDLSTLSQLMGHSSVVVTSDFYAVFTSKELQQIHRKYSPLNTLK